MRRPLNRSSAPVVIRFFDLCFKQGVIDACDFGDDYGAKEFLDQHRAAWDFGVLGEPDDFDWEMWRFTMYRWARGNHMTRFSQDFIYRIVKKHYLWYFLPYCMRFYLMGIAEWLEYPNSARLEIFKGESKVHWKPVDKGLRKMNVNDFISYMQEFCYEFRRSPLSKGEDRIMSPAALDAFCQAIHDLTRKYDTGKTLRIKEFEKDDI